MALQIVVIAEARADYLVTSHLVDRTVLESASTPSWLTEDPPLLEQERHYCGLDPESDFSERRKMKAKSAGFGKKQAVFVGKFGSRKSMPSDMWDTKRCIENTVISCPNCDALILSRDSDGDEERVDSWYKTAEESQPHVNFTIIIAGQICKLEAWILNGFEPQNNSEAAALKEVRTRLGFSPVIQSERLTARSAGAKKDAKQILDKLAISYDRKEKCWQQTDLGTLNTNGQGSGLSRYLTDVSEKILPLFSW
ncbi:MAG: hypothetical protein AAF226_05655 [Verrucomicrobiota bacterium]